MTAAAHLDEDAFGPYCDFLAGGGLDGLLAFGTNGEAVLFSVEERRRGLRLFVEASAGRLQVAAHCGAQTTADTVALAADAAEAGRRRGRRDRPAVLPARRAALSSRTLPRPPRACAPLPFYVYEFAATSGYPIALDVLARLRDEARQLRRPEGLGHARGRRSSPTCSTASTCSSGRRR